MKIFEKNRSTAIAWWNEKTAHDKVQLTDKYFYGRIVASLTGREIQLVWQGEIKPIKIPPTPSTKGLEEEAKAKYGWEDEFYRRMEINGYSRAEFIPEISDSVELFREFIQLGYFK